jgi:hypothetical protein
VEECPSSNCQLLVLQQLLFDYVLDAARAHQSHAHESCALVADAFGSIWMDSDLEDADIEYSVRAGVVRVRVRTRETNMANLLIQAIENNRESVVRLLLKSGANVNLPDTKLGDTPLIRASYTNDTWADSGARPLTALVRLLLLNRADPNRRNKAGETALTLAANLGHSDIVAALLKSGANFRLRNKQGLTPLKLASIPVPRGSISFGGSMPNLKNPNDPTQVDKDIREHEKMLERMARDEEKRLAMGRAKAKRLLQAAGAKQRAEASKRRQDKALQPTA